MDTTYGSAAWKRVSWGKPREWRTYWGWTIGGQEQYRDTEFVVLKRDCKRVDSQTVAADITGSTLPTFRIGGGATDTLSGATPWRPDAPDLKDVGTDRSEVTVKWQRVTKTWTNWP